MATLQECEDNVRKLTEGLGFDEEEIRSRARILYILSRLQDIDSLSIFLLEVQYQKKLAVEEERKNPML